MAKQNEFEQMAQIAKAEISRDAPQYVGSLDLSAGKTAVNTDVAAQIVANNWSDPTFRHDLYDQETPERIIELLLRAQGTIDQDTGKPMTVAAYKSKVLQPFMESGTSPYLQQDLAANVPPSHTPMPVHPIFGSDGGVLPQNAPPPSDPGTSTAESASGMSTPPAPQTVAPAPAAPAAPPASAPLDIPQLGAPGAPA